ncbi:MAG: flagellar biosynthetic protein FliO [Treponema sp.]|jgi:flagellar protein FliO/FliZ|nr:flagellar biosynthetic protein FliO [Treponema sp.]
MAIFFIIIHTPVIFAQEATQDTPQTTGGEALLRNQAVERALPLGEEAAAVSATGAASAFTLLRMLLVLALAALAIYGVVIFMKRISRPAQQKDPHLKVLARVPLGAGSVAAVVAVGSKAWLVGAGESNVSLLAEITDQELIDTMLLDESRRVVETGGKLADFGALLRRATGRTATGGLDTALDNGLRPENVRKRRERLKEL